MDEITEVQTYCQLIYLSDNQEREGLYYYTFNGLTCVTDKQEVSFYMMGDVSISKILDMIKVEELTHFSLQDSKGRTYKMISW